MKYDVWLYATTVEADSATEAELKVQAELDKITEFEIRVDYAEEINWV